MKEKRDCKVCGVPLKDWQVKRGYDMCLDCYNERKSSHRILKEEALEEETEKEIDEEDLEHSSSNLEDDLQGKEEED